jgi:ABC-type glycerol-3-phosphate transport system substrate-binding protein
MTSDSTTVNRRRFIEATGVAGIVGLAGCSGGGDGGGGANGSGGGTTGTTSDGQTGGATISYWSVLHQQSQVARLALENLISQFENQTNHTVEPNWSITQSIQDGTWLQNMNSQQAPILYDSQVSRNGQFIEAGFVEPFEEQVVPELSSEIQDGIEWNLDRMANLYAGFEKDVAYEMMLGTAMQEPFVVRTDHMEEAGLNPDNDFPPTDYDELIELARTLQQDGPADYGFQVHGSPGDLMDEIMPTWAMSYGGVDGLYVNQDWSDTNLDNEHWKRVLSEQVEIFRDMELSTPNASSTSDEAACQLMIDGQVSMSQVGMLNAAGLIANRAPDMYENGTFRYGPSWEGTSGFRGEYNVTSMSLCRDPDMDDATYERKKQAAIEFMEFLLDPENQANTFEWWGIMPSNQSAWEQTRGPSHMLPSTAFTIAEQSDYGWQAHPQMSDIQYNIPGPIFQQAMTGDLSPEEACDQAAQQIRNQVFN